MESGPIGIFDSGYGGLTIYQEIVRQLPQYDYIYLGDNARVPYGNRSFEVINEYTKDAIEFLFEKGCRLVILACNTASAKALRSYQQIHLPKVKGLHKVLGVIRPTTEIIGSLSTTKKIGVFATQGTVSSGSYEIEIKKFTPEAEVFQQACPLWVPLIENQETDSDGARYFVKKYVDELMAKSDQIDSIILGCTHFPLLKDLIEEYLPPGVQVYEQGQFVAESLTNYLVRHPEVEERCSKNGNQQFLTTETAENFDQQATLFLGHPVVSQKVHL